jgi:hypothetical protein
MTNNEKNEKNDNKLIEINDEILPQKNSWYFKIPFIFSLLVKIKLCMIIFSRNFYIPSIRFSNGVEIDFEKNRIILNDPTEIVCNDTLKLISKKHLILRSGQGQEEEREGYRYSIWLNSPEDDRGNPLKKPIEKLLKNNNNKCGCKCNCSDCDCNDTGCGDCRCNQKD